MRIGNVPHEALQGGRHLEWKEGNLQAFVHNYFSVPPIRGHDRLKLEKSFYALNIQKIGGIRIRWTNNLDDHLRMVDDDTALFIFHHASFLEHQLHK